MISTHTRISLLELKTFNLKLYECVFSDLLRLSRYDNVHLSRNIECNLGGEKQYLTALQIIERGILL